MLPGQNVIFALSSSSGSYCTTSIFVIHTESSASTEGPSELGTPHLVSELCDWSDKPVGVGEELVDTNPSDRQGPSQGDQEECCEQPELSHRHGFPSPLLVLLCVTRLRGNDLQKMCPKAITSGASGRTRCGSTESRRDLIFSACPTSQPPPSHHRGFLSRTEPLFADLFLFYICIVRFTPPPTVTMKRAAATITGPRGGSWDVFIGLEVHAQIQLRSKLFSRSQAAAPSEHDEPNSRYDNIFVANLS